VLRGVFCGFVPEVEVGGGGMDGLEFGDHAVADSGRGNRLGLGQGPIVDVRAKGQSLAVGETSGHGHPDQLVRLVRLDRAVTLFNF